MPFDHLPAQSGTLTFAGASTGDLSASVNSDKIYVNNWKYLFIEATTSSASALNGAFKVQVSYDGTNWSDYPSSSTNVTTNTTVSWDIELKAAPIYRLAYTRTGGSATVSVKFCGRN